MYTMDWRVPNDRRCHQCGEDLLKLTAITPEGKNLLVALARISVMDRLEIEPTPVDEEQRIVPRDLRERRNWRNNLSWALTTILPLAALAILVLFGVSILNEAQSSANSKNDNKRNTPQFIAGFDGSGALGAKQSN